MAQVLDLRFARLNARSHPDHLMTGKVGVHVDGGTALFNDIAIRQILERSH